VWILLCPSRDPYSLLLSGLASIVKTRGNMDTHVILRGGTKGPNYASEYVKEAAKAIHKKKEWASIMVDCSRTFAHFKWIHISHTLPS
jgi:phospho-2-dehydro-3-deoxyheptonate aldolase